MGLIKSDWIQFRNSALYLSHFIFQYEAISLIVQEDDFELCKVTKRTGDSFIVERSNGVRGVHQSKAILV